MVPTRSLTSVCVPHFGALLTDERSFVARVFRFSGFFSRRFCDFGDCACSHDSCARDFAMSSQKSGYSSINDEDTGTSTCCPKRRWSSVRKGVVIGSIGLVLSIVFVGAYFGVNAFVQWQLNNVNRVEILLFYCRYSLCNGRKTF